jgi:prepilin-type N-terminal cleavage/methylation domain-containing protein
MRKLPKRDGFTLIELLITMVIIAILAMIGITVFWRAKDRGLEASLQSDLKTVAVQQEIYFGSRGTYASTPTTLPDFQTSPGVNVAITYAAADGWAAVTTHPSISGSSCGYIAGDAPGGSAPPATTAGIVMCTNQ